MKDIAVSIAVWAACSSLPAHAEQDYIDSPSGVSTYTSTFKTYNGKSLKNLLASYGLRIEYVSLTPIEKMMAAVRKPGDRDGDVVAVLSISGRVKPMPCGLHKWLTQGTTTGVGADMAEIIYRRGQWIADAENSSPLLYWAQTGKCSASYGLPM